MHAQNSLMQQMQSARLNLAVAVKNWDPLDERRVEKCSIALQSAIDDLLAATSNDLTFVHAPLAEEVARIRSCAIRLNRLLGAAAAFFRGVSTASGLDTDLREPAEYNNANSLGIA